MASNDDTEIEWLKGEIIPKLLKDQQLLKEEVAINDFDKFEIKNITLQFIGAEEAFMLTQCYRARIEYGFKGDTGEINIFVKVCPLCYIKNVYRQKIS